MLYKCWSFIWIISFIFTATSTNWYIIPFYRWGKQFAHSLIHYICIRDICGVNLSAVGTVVNKASHIPACLMETVNTLSISQAVSPMEKLNRAMRLGRGG